MATKIELKDQFERLIRHIKFYSGQKDKSEWRRDGHRFLWQVPAQVQVLDATDVAEPVDVWTGTISKSGLDFLSPRKLQRGQKVLITLEANNSQVQILGTVIHSTDLFSRDKVGVKFDLEES